MLLLRFFSYLLILPLVFSLRCYTFQSPSGTNFTNAQKTSVECPSTSRFCVCSFQQSLMPTGNPTMMETRGCGDDLMCRPHIRAQHTGCLGSGYDKMCCCMGDHCNENME